MDVTTVTAQGEKASNESGVGSPELARFLDEFAAARAGEACHALIHQDLSNLGMTCDFYPFLPFPKVGASRVLGDEVSAAV